MSTLMFLFLFFVIVPLICYCFFKKRRDGALPPSPPSLPLIGHVHHFFQTPLLGTLEKLATRCGPFFHLRIFGIPILVVSSASVAHDVFRANDINVSFRGLPAADESLFFGAAGVVNSAYGDYWRMIKRLMVDKFVGSKALEKSRGIRAEELQRFYSTLHDKAEKMETVDISKEVMKVVSGVIGRMSFGRRLREEEVELLKSIIAESNRLMTKMFMAVVFRRHLKMTGLSPFSRQIMRVSNKFDKMLESILEEHQVEPNKDQKSEILDALLAAYADDKITRENVKAFYTELLVGAIDTSSTTAVWAVAELVKKPEALEALRTEIDSIVGKKRLVEEGDIPKLPYLNAVIKETLRLHPPGPLLPREVHRECEIAGFTIPANTSMIVNVYQIMRDPSVWEDPLKFAPERFLVSSQPEKVIKFLPFGSGRRACPGETLGTVIVAAAVAIIVHGFEWNIEGGVNMEEHLEGAVLTMAHSPQISLATRLE